MESYTWRPALLARARQVGVSDRGFAEAGGPLRDWADLDEIGWAFDRIEPTVIVSLRLRWGRREIVVGYRGRGPMPADCARMLRAVLSAVAAARPDMKVVLGHGGKTRRALFIASVVLALLGQAAVVLGLWWLVTASFVEALGPGIAGTVVTAMAVGLALANRPWIVLPHVPITDVIAGFDVAQDRLGAR